MAMRFACSILCFALIMNCASCAVPYDFFKLVYQWPKSRCHSQSKCPPFKPNLFTIHGLWPAKYRSMCDPDLTYLVGGELDIKQLGQDSDLWSRLHESWPDTDGNNAQFWEKEYNKHGRCSDDLLPQKNYFDKADSLWRDYNVTEAFELSNITSGYNWPQSDIITAIQSIPKLSVMYPRYQPILRCLKESQIFDVLTDVVICFDKVNFNPINCPPMAGSCWGDIYFPGP